MGRKFDARLPDMTDEEIYAVDEGTLDETSQQALKKEKEKRGRANFETQRADVETRRAEDKIEQRREKRITWAIAIAVLLAMIVIAVFD